MGTHNTIRTLIGTVLILVGAISIVMAILYAFYQPDKAGIVVIAEIVAPTPTPTPTPSIPSSGEYVNDTKFNNVSFILDYQMVNGTVLATMTQVYESCYYGTPSDVLHNTNTVDMKVDGTSVTINAYFGVGNQQPVDGAVTFVGIYDVNEGFVLTTSQITSTASTAPQTLIFTQYPNPPALPDIESKFRNGELKATNC